MKNITRFWAFALAVLMILPMLYIPISAETEGAIPEYGEYYYHYDFENYEGTTFYLPTYLHSTTVTTKDGLLCNPLKDTTFNSTPNGTSKIIDENGNKYLNHTFSNNDKGSGRIGAFNIGEEMLRNAVAFDFRFRAKGGDADDKDTMINLVELRRGGAGTCRAILQTDGLGRIYASNLDILGISDTSTTPVLIYEPAAADEFMEISVRWYDVTNTVSVYINGDPYIESARITTDFRASNADPSKNYVNKTWSDSFLLKDLSLGNDTSGTVQLLNAKTNLSWSFDVDDIRMYPIATPEGLPYYYQNNFEGFDSLTEGTTRNGAKPSNGTYDFAYGNENIKKATEGDNSYVTILSGVVNNVDLGPSDGFGIRDQTYQTLSTSSWVLEFEIRNTTHSDSALRQIITYEDGGLGNVSYALYLDKDGNLYTGTNTSTRIAGVNISGNEWTHIAVVCVNDMSNADMFGSFSSTDTAKNSAVKLRRTFAFYIDGKYVGATEPKDIYTWNNATGKRTLNGYDISAITNHTETLDTSTASGLIVVDETTTANHTIYKSADGLTYYDVEYTDEKKETQVAYSKMTLTAANVGARGEYLGLFYYNNSTINASLDNIKLYEGNYPIFMTENAVNEQDGTLLDIDFGSYVFPNNSKSIVANGNSSNETVTGDVHGIITSGTSFNISSYVKKYNATGDEINTNYGDTDYVNITSSGGGWQDLFFPHSATGVYSFEHTLKNVAPTANQALGFFTIRREDNNGNATSQPLIQAKENEDGDVQLYTHYYDEIKEKDENGKDQVVARGKPLYYKDGTPALLEGNGWQTIKVIYDESLTKHDKHPCVSFYLDGNLLYLDAEGKVPAKDISDDQFVGVYNRRNTSNQRIRYYYGSASKGQFDIKSLTIKSADMEHEMTDLNTDAVLKLKNSVTVIESTIKFTKYSADTNIYYPLVELTRTDANTTLELGLLYAEANDGLLYVKNTDGDYEKLYDADGHTLAIETDPNADPTSVAIVYDDVTGLARYYVDGYLPYIGDGDTKTPASNVQVYDLAFYRMAAKSEGIKLLAETACGNAANITADAYTTNYSGTAEIAGIQTSPKSQQIGDETVYTTDIRLLAGIDHKYYGTAGFEFQVIYDGESNDVKSVATPSVFKYIKEDGNEDPIYAKTKGYNYFATAEITGVPTGVPDNSYIYVRPYTTVAGVKTYGAAAKIPLPLTLNNTGSDEETYFDGNYEEKFVRDNGNLFECSEIESFEGNGLAFNNEGAIFNFNANCDGKVYISLDSSRGLASVNESVFELTVDDETSIIRLPIGRNHILLADVEDGDHAFSLKKISGGDFVRINSVTLDGEYKDPTPTAVENGVIVKVDAPAEEGGLYGNVTVYVQTTDESGDYYIEYPFVYQKKTDTNVNMYRINKGFIVEKNGDGSFTQLYQVLRQGEICVAIFETKANNGIESGRSDDAIGGFHGDENLLQPPVFLLDGKRISLSEAGEYTGTTLDVEQVTELNRCNSPEEKVMKHTQIFKFDTNGLRMKRSLEFLTSDFVPKKGQTYLQMFTFARQDLMEVDKGNFDAPDLCNTVNLLDAAGNKLFVIDTEKYEVTDVKNNNEVTSFSDGYVKNGAVISECSYLGNSVDNRYAEYIGDNNNGIYAKVGFNITDASTKVDSAYIMARKGVFDPAEIDPELKSGTHGDNKWYPSFTSSNDPTPVCKDTTATGTKNNNDTVYIPAKGETWNVDLIYRIDYNNPDNSVNPVS